METTNLTQDKASEPEQLMASKAELLKHAEKSNESTLSTLSISDSSKQTGRSTASPLDSSHLEKTTTEKPKKATYSNYAKERGIKPKSGSL